VLIIFDCDGVLVDSELIANRALAAHLSAQGYPVTANECLGRFIGMTIPGVIAKVQNEGVVLPDDFEATLRAKDQIVFARELKPVSGVEHALQRLDGRPRCVASSGSPEKIARNLDITGLRKYFEDNLFSAKDVQRPKPAPDLFHLAAARMNADAGRCIVIEDTALGIEGAKRAGMRALGFIGGSHRVPADAAVLRAAGADDIFDDMHRLPDLISAIE